MTWIVMWLLIITACAFALFWESFRKECEKEGERRRIRDEKPEAGRAEVERQCQVQKRRLEAEKKARRQQFFRFDLHRKMGGKEMPPDWDLRSDYVLKRDGHKCVHCGRTTDLQIHHKNPRAISEDHSVSNLETVCIACHAKMPGRGHSLLRFVPTKRDRDIKARLYAYTQRRSRKQHVCDRCEDTIDKGDYNYVERWYNYEGQERICEDCLLKHVAPRH